MSIKARGKMISFRLSTEEYEQFRHFCDAQSKHSISELARVAVNKLVADPGLSGDNPLESRINDLEGQLHMLALELKRVKQIAAPELVEPLVYNKVVR